MVGLKTKYGDWAFITGASSGIGLEFAKRLAEEGINMILAARRIKTLEEFKNEYEKKYNIQIIPLEIDLTDENIITKISPAIVNKEVSILINNAGFGSTGEYLSNSVENDVNMIKRAEISRKESFKKAKMEQNKFIEDLQTEGYGYDYNQPEAQDQYDGGRGAGSLGQPID